MKTYTKGTVVEVGLGEVGIVRSEVGMEGRGLRIILVWMWSGEGM